MALIFVLSAQPGLRISSDAGVDGPVRHLVHVAMYAILAILLVHAMDAVSWPTVAVVAVAIATLYGVTDELHQSLVPERSGNALDVGFDAVGAVLGVAVARWVPRRRRGWRPG
jgi:VanZ family protein